jgi:hypothetical protein
MNVPLLPAPPHPPPPSPMSPPSLVCSLLGPKPPSASLRCPISERRASAYSSKSNSRTNGGTVDTPPKVREICKHPTEILEASDDPRTLGVNRSTWSNPPDKATSLDEEHIEELFGQLWAIPNSESVRVQKPEHGSGCLVWIHKNQVKARQIWTKDCYDVSPLNKNG